MNLASSLARSLAAAARAVGFLLAVPFLAVWLGVQGARERRGWPRTVDEAVDQLLARMDEPTKEWVRTCPFENLVQLDLGLGMDVRNSFGLWQGNKALLRSCGSEDLHPDGASGVIIYHLWERLRGRQEPAANPGDGGPGVQEPKAE